MSNLEHVNPMKPVAAYLGGKSRLARIIIERIESISHNTYAEPFVGMGGVFFRRSLRSKCEVINDLDKDIATFFRVAKYHVNELAKELTGYMFSREEFNRLRAIPAETLTDIQRSARFFYLLKMRFGGDPRSSTWAVSPGSKAPFRYSDSISDIRALTKRMESVAIECLPFDSFMKRYDRPDTLFYVDPPYYGCEMDYTTPFNRSNFNVLADVMKELKGRAIVSLNDTPEVRKIFQDFDMESLSTKYSFGGNRARPRNEVLIYSKI